MSWLTGVFETGVGRGVGIMRHDGKAKEVEGEFSHDTLASDGHRSRPESFMSYAKRPSLVPACHMSCWKECLQDAKSAVDTPELITSLQSTPAGPSFPARS